MLESLSEINVVTFPYHFINVCYFWLVNKSQIWYILMSFCKCIPCILKSSFSAMSGKLQNSETEILI